VKFYLAEEVFEHLLEETINLLN